MSDSADDALALGIQIGALINQARLFDPDELRRMIADSERFDSIQPILNPTLWRDNYQRVDRVKRAAELVLAFRTAIAEMDGRR